MASAVLSKITRVFSGKKQKASDSNFSIENLRYIRTLLLLIAVMYPLWWYTSWKYSAALHDPLLAWNGRIMVGILALFFWCLTYVHEFFRRHAYALMIIACWVLSIHYMNVVRLNALSPMRIFGMFQIVSTLFMSFLTLPSVLGFGLWMMALAGWVAQTPSEFPGKVLVPAMALLTLIIFLSLRVRVRLIDRLTESRKAIKAVLDNVPTGFLTFTRDGKVQPGYSRATAQLFAQDQIDGKSFAQVLGLNPQVEKEEMSSFLEVAFRDALPFNDAAGLAPQAVRTKGNYGERYIALAYHPIYDEASGEGKGRTLEKVIVVATDKTTEKKLEAQVKRQQDVIRAISCILERRNEFAEFVSSIHELVQSTPQNPTELIRVLHTVKGASHMYFLTDLGDLAHEMESTAKEMERCSESDRREIFGKIREKLKRFEGVLEQFLLQNEKILGKFDQTLGAVTERKVSPEKVMELLRETVAVAGLESPITRKMLEEFYWTNPAQALLRYVDIVKNIAERQGKEVKVEIHSPKNLQVFINDYRGFFASCVHLFRNAVDHGIETGSERAELGKPEVGTIRCEFTFDPAAKQIHLVLEDDGNGIDPEAVKRKAVSSGVLDPAQAAKLSSQEAIELVFLPGFSTKTEVTELSGRGVGLDAVKVEAERMGGSVAVQSELGKGSRFVFKLPYRDGKQELTQLLR